MFATQNKRMETKIRNGVRYLIKIAQNAAARRGKMRTAGTNQANNNPEERPAIIEKRGKNSGLSISKSPFRYSATTLGGLPSSFQIYITHLIHLKGFIITVTCSIRAAVHNLSSGLFINNIYMLHTAALSLCRIHTIIFE